MTNKKITWEKRFDEELCTKCDDGVRMLMDIYEVDKVKEFIRKLLIQEYRKGYNVCLKEQGLTGQEHQHLHL